MTSFVDGPAAGVALALRRDPMFLRVVRGLQPGKAKPQWDALDQLGDAPGIHESIYCYERVECEGTCHIRGAGFSGFFAMAKYKLTDPQPSESTMRSCRRWPEWCEEEFEKRRSARQAPTAADEAHEQTQEPSA